jgi:hypothetical protein
MIPIGSMGPYLTTQFKTVPNVEKKLELLTIWKIKETFTQKLTWKITFTHVMEVSSNSSNP